MAADTQHQSSEALAGTVAAAPEYLTAREVADMLQVSEKSVLRWAKDDPSMPCLQIGGRTLRFPRARLLAWLRVREQGAGRAKRFRQPVPSEVQRLEEQRVSMNGDQ